MGSLQKIFDTIVSLWYFRNYLRKHFSVFTRIDTEVKQLFGRMNTQSRMPALLGFLAMFLCMELCWRIMFEVMIGYFDMHDYLHTIANTQALK